MNSSFKQVGYYASLPSASFSFTESAKVKKFFNKKWLHVWALSKSFITINYYLDDRFKVWRFMGAM
jgi:hypothetical protein